MKENRFDTDDHNIRENDRLRDPQREGFGAIESYFSTDPREREVGIVLPVGCGKSGLIAISPFATKSSRTLVVAPGLKIKDQLAADFDPSNEKMFYQKCGVLSGSNYPEPAVISGSNANIGDLEVADVVITNIHQIQGENNRWLSEVSEDFFDLILVDEGHHNVAESWERVVEMFPNAKVVNFSATPTRGDGQVMRGQVIYSFPIFRAIEAGYVKRLKAKVLNPASLRYIRHDEGREIEVSLKEIISLGESDPAFRRSIVSSEETLATIVDCSIRELRGLRERTGEARHKIIASALNYSHCVQITAAFQERGIRAEYIHSSAEGDHNRRTLERLENHDLDAIVQVRMLGEGFDHPFLSVAAVCSVFSSLTPFAQFVGRIMRVVDQNDPSSPNNEGIVVFHAGANVARRWTDFRVFSEADQDYFDQLLPVEGIDFTESSEVSLEPRLRTENFVEIMAQESVTIEERPLLEGDAEALAALRLLESRGYEVKLQPIPVTRQRKRQASRSELDSTVKIKAGEILAKRGINPRGFELDARRLGKENFVTVKSAIDRKCNELVGAAGGSRSDMTQDQLDQISESLDSVLRKVEEEIFRG